MSLQAGKLTIQVNDLMTTEGYEKLEEWLREFLREQGISAVIEDPVTGNTTTTDDREEEELTEFFVDFGSWSIQAQNADAARSKALERLASGDRPEIDSIGEI